jgi:hypothetical protein
MTSQQGINTYVCVSTPQHVNQASTCLSVLLNQNGSILKPDLHVEVLIYWAAILLVNPYPFKMAEYIAWKT